MPRGGDDRALAVKRGVDVVGALLGLAIAALPMAIVAVAILTKMGPPVFLRQRRPGLQGRLFTLYKFRTMRDIRDQRGRLLPDEARMTKLGRVLRHTSLDELPELWNVLRGDMSLVGPRPLLPQYLSRYSPEQARRHEVLPGITGWAKVSGRNALTWKEKFALDAWYMDNWNLRLDFKILWMTCKLVLKREGISAGGHATMPEFRGEAAD